MIFLPFASLAEKVGDLRCPKQMQFGDLFVEQFGRGANCTHFCPALL